jgi:hypothetical protein
MPRHSYDKRPLKDRMFVYTVEEVGAIIGYDKNTIYRWRKDRGGFPTLPTTKPAIWSWLQRIGRPEYLYKRRSATRRAVVALWEQGLNKSEIVRELHAQGVMIDWPGVHRHIRKELERRALERKFGVL